MEKQKLDNFSKYGGWLIFSLIFAAIIIVTVGEIRIYELKKQRSPIENEIVNYPDCITIELSDTLVGYRGKVSEEGVWVHHANDVSDELFTFFNTLEYSECEECVVCKKSVLITQLKTITYQDWMSGDWETILTQN